MVSLHLDPALLDRLSQAGVERVSLSSDTAGIHVAINGKALPSLTWADGEVAHLLGVTEQMGLTELWTPGVNWQDLSTLMRSVLPVIQSAEFDLTISLPPSHIAASDKKGSYHD